MIKRSCAVWGVLVCKGGGATRAGNRDSPPPAVVTSCCRGKFPTVDRRRWVDASQVDAWERMNVQ